MRVQQILIGCAISLAVSGLTLAADAPPAPKPGPEHQKLGYFVGKWTSKGEMKASPYGPGGKMMSTDKCEWFDGKFAVICRGTGTGPTGPSKSLGILGYSAEEKAYTYYGVDNTAMTQTTVPKGTIDGDTWTYNDESKMGGNLVKSRYVIKIVSPTAYTFKYEMQGEGGSWNTVLEGTETKEGKKTAK